jgi:GNAT superfamily N-acetyltransferase
VTLAGPVLVRHLRARLGAWPPELPLDVIGSDERTTPGWDGEVRPLLGVLDPDPPELGEPGLLLSVPPAAVEPIELLGGLDPGVLSEPSWRGAVTQALGAPGRDLRVGVFRWLEEASGLADLDELGTWVPRDDPALPPWLRPFDGPEVLVLRDADGRHVAGVGIKSHDEHGAEVAVVTDGSARDRGIGRRLVATAVRRILTEGRVATYLHDPANVASARLADAVGLRDEGWRVVDLTDG